MSKQTEIEYQALCQATDAEEKDAVRYRWLMNGHTETELQAAYEAATQPKLTAQMMVISKLSTYYFTKEQADAEIDEAMQNNGGIH